MSENQYIQVVYKKLRNLRKRAARVDDIEMLARAGKELDSSQMDALIGKDGLLSLIKELESVHASLVEIEATSSKMEDGIVHEMMAEAGAKSADSENAAGNSENAAEISENENNFSNSNSIGDIQQRIRLVVLLLQVSAKGGKAVPPEVEYFNSLILGKTSVSDFNTTVEHSLKSVGLFMFPEKAEGMNVLGGVTYTQLVDKVKGVACEMGWRDPTAPDLDVDVTDDAVHNDGDDTKERKVSGSSSSGGGQNIGKAKAKKAVRKEDKVEEGESKKPAAGADAVVVVKGKKQKKSSRAALSAQPEQEKEEEEHDDDDARSGVTPTEESEVKKKRGRGRRGGKRHNNSSGAHEERQSDDQKESAPPPPPAAAAAASPFSEGGKGNAHGGGDAANPGANGKGANVKRRGEGEGKRKGGGKKAGGGMPTAAADVGVGKPDEAKAYIQG